MTIRYIEHAAIEDFECQFCKQIIRKGEKYLRHNVTPGSSPTKKWWSVRAHGRYPNECPDPQEENAS